MNCHDLSCEPMDIDLSNQSIRDMDISYEDAVDDVKQFTRPPSRILVPPPKDYASFGTINLTQQPVIKKYHINTRRQKYTIHKTIVWIIIIFISIIVYNVHNLKCCDQLDLEIIRETLTKNLYGQTAAMNLIIKTLEDKERSKILFLSGGTGVGKTLTSSLLLETIGTCSNVYHYTMPTFESTFSTDFLFGLTMCKTSLFVVDDLTIKDIDIKVKIKNLIDKSEDLKKEITVILIYHCDENHQDLSNRCDEIFRNKILDNFSDVKVLKKFIQFEPLSEKHLRHCIKQELGDRNINNNEFEELLKIFNVNNDGCKGVYSKMKYLNII